MSALGAVPASAAAQPASAEGGHARTAVFEQYRPGADAVTYSLDRVPVGARASVLSYDLGGRTVVALAVTGLPPNTEYGAHVHVRPCGPNPADSGPHFQNVPDPNQPSTDPAYANPRNEVWLDFTTNRRGSALAVSRVAWTFGDRQADSIVLHEHHTHVGGAAGARLGCVRFG
ncbi:superoxide dismutase [Actinokineospora fastidiosa]|uniref:superoxide dismutase n=1 Tax=Actinokineospora fastidiosa TaxID=1816 RepID=UPI003570DD76